MIIEAAIRRFGHFGIAKTTMAEIARDLSMSKASLYYYFPDKTSLFAASLEHVIRGSYDDIAGRVTGIQNSQEAMLFLLDRRMEFITQNYKLFEYFFGIGPTPPRELTALMTGAKDSQAQLIRQVLQNGVDRGELKAMDANEMAHIVLFAIEGMRFSILRDMDGLLFPTAEEFSTILALQKKMVTILMAGLAAG